MSEDHDTDEATKRALGALRAANPAPAGADPNEESALQGVRARVMLAVRDDFEAVAPSRVRRRRFAWPRIAIAASAAVAVGFAGALIGWNAAPDAATGVGASERTGVALVRAPEAAVQNGAAAGASADTAGPGAGTKEMTSAVYGGPTVLEPGPSLLDGSGVANGYRYERDDIDTRALAAAIAAAFGVEGEPRDEGGSWIVGSTDWMGPTVSVAAYGDVVSWSYSDPTVGACATIEPRGDEPGTGESAGAAGSAADGTIAEPVPCESTEQGAPPGAEEARAKTERMIETLGLPVDGLEWETWSDATGASATAWRTVDGMRTSLMTSVWFGPGGRIGTANGQTATLVGIPDYPLVGARTAVLRAQTPGWSQLVLPVFSGGVMPMVVEGAAGGAASEFPRRDGRPVAVVPLTRVVVDDAQPTLYEIYTPDGRSLLLPGYRVTDADGNAWSIPAVADGYVSFATP